MAQATAPNAAFQRLMIQRGVSQRTDDLWAYLDEPGYKRELGAAAAAPRSNWVNRPMGSGSVDFSTNGNGGTPSDPGGYNWNTLSNVASGAAQGISWIRNTINTARQFNKAKKAQKMADLQRTYANTFDPNMQYGAIYQGAASAATQKMTPKQPRTSSRPPKTTRPGGIGTVPIKTPTLPFPTK